MCAILSWNLSIATLPVARRLRLARYDGGDLARRSILVVCSGTCAGVAIGAEAESPRDDQLPGPPGARVVGPDCCTLHEWPGCLGCLGWVGGLETHP